MSVCLSVCLSVRPPASEELENCWELKFVLSNFKTWSLTLREEHRLTVIESRVLRRIFGPKRVEVTGG
jgi:hypothetical protein